MAQKTPDFTTCSLGYREYGGSDNKLSIEYEGNKYMLKLPEFKQTKNDLQTSHVNNVLSEHIGSHIIKSLGLDVHDTILGVYNGNPAVACRDFTGNGYRLQEFSWLMRSFYDKSEVRRIPSYNQLYEVIEKHPLLNGIREQAISRYWQTFAADAVIGNFDRHKGNWGYLVNEATKDVKLAPIYDCGSSLYPGIAEDKMSSILSSQEEIEKRLYLFPKAALNMNNTNKEDKLGYYEALSSNFDRNCTKAFLEIYPRVRLSEINRIVENTPFVSDKRIEFYETMLHYRKELILDRALDLLIEKAKNQVIEERNGELSIKKCPAEYYDIVKYMYANEKDCLIISDRGEAAYIGDINICNSICREFRGELSEHSNSCEWNGMIQNAEELENYTAYMVRNYDLER